MSFAVSINLKKKLFPGIMVECKSGRFLAYYEHRDDIMASGENEPDAKKNLKKMYKTVMGYEKKEGIEREADVLPSDTKTKKFVEKF